MTQVKLEGNKSSYLQSPNWLLKSKAPLCGCINTSLRSRFWSESDHHSDPSQLREIWFRNSDEIMDLACRPQKILFWKQHFMAGHHLSARCWANGYFSSIWQKKVLQCMWMKSMEVKVRFGVLCCKILQSTEKVSWDTQNKLSHALSSYPTGCQLWLTTHVVWQKAEHKQKAWYQENLARKLKHRATPHQFEPLCTAAHWWEEQQCPILPL